MQGGAGVDLVQHLLREVMVDVASVRGLATLRDEDWLRPLVERGEV